MSLSSLLNKIKIVLTAKFQSVYDDQIIIIDEAGVPIEGIHQIVEDRYLGVVRLVQKTKTPVNILFEKRVLTVSLRSLEHAPNQHRQSFKTYQDGQKIENFRKQVL